MVILPPFSDTIIKQYIDERIQTQGAGFDLTIEDILTPEEGGVLDFDNSKRLIPKYKPVKREKSKWKLKKGGYIVKYNELIEVPLDAIGVLFPRSSLMRIGATIYSAVWDPGYKGKGLGLLQTTTDITIYENARIAQIIFLKTQKRATKGYNGNYQNEGIKIKREEE